MQSTECGIVFWPQSGDTGFWDNEVWEEGYLFHQWLPQVATISEKRTHRLTNERTEPHIGHLYRNERTTLIIALRTKAITYLMNFMLDDGILAWALCADKRQQSKHSYPGIKKFEVKVW